MTRNAIIGMLLREMAEEMPIVLRALPDDRLWSAMVSGLLADDDIETLAEKIAEFRIPHAETADWREVYGAMRDMVNETAVGHWSPVQASESVNAAY
jgi:aminoglycoside phosphotransferase family enzyme